jgi:hypothetical protein
MSCSWVRIVKIIKITNSQATMKFSLTHSLFANSMPPQSNQFCSFLAAAFQLLTHIHMLLCSLQNTFLLMLKNEIKRGEKLISREEK